MYTNMDGVSLCAVHYVEWEEKRTKQEMIDLCQQIINIVGYDRYWKLLDAKFPGAPDTPIVDAERLQWARKTIYELKQVEDVRSNDLGSK